MKNLEKRYQLCIIICTNIFWIITIAWCNQALLIIPAFFSSQSTLPPGPVSFPPIYHKSRDDDLSIALGWIVLSYLLEQKRTHFYSGLYLDHSRSNWTLFFHRLSQHLEFISPNLILNHIYKNGGTDGIQTKIPFILVIQQAREGEEGKWFLLRVATSPEAGQSTMQFLFMFPFCFLRANTCSTTLMMPNSGQS